jgi:UDP-galactopyranose mutase
VPNAYCLWKKGFERKLDEANSIVSAFENIRCLGRQAEFKYYNMDHCLSRSFLVADSIKKFFGFGNGKPH